jgi:2-oxoglutarate dehydrogenase E2 component (dihydrolipoamide succinyltransferase)
MYELTVPTLNSNDASYVLTDWLFDDGDLVPVGAEVAVIETSKAAEGLVCEAAGILRRETMASRECRPGQVVARLFDDADERDAWAARVAAEPDDPTPPELVLTEPARLLAERHGLDLERLRGIGQRVVDRAAVQRLLDDGGDGRPDRGQEAVARTVTIAHHTIPAAHATVTVAVDAALAALARYGEREGTPVRLPELLIRAVADLLPRHPKCCHPAPATEPGVAVTIDVGRGLTMPVVRGPALASLRTIADRLAGFRETALHGHFVEADLAGGTIGLSLPAGEVVLVQPLIQPGQAGMLWLGATQTVPHLEPDGRVVARRVVNVGLAYDHRVINGRDAALFLGDLKRALERPRHLERLVA